MTWASQAYNPGSNPGDRISSHYCTLTKRIDRYRHRAFCFLGGMCVSVFSQAAVPSMHKVSVPGSISACVGDALWSLSVTRFCSLGTGRYYMPADRPFSIIQSRVFLRRCNIRVDKNNLSATSFYLADSRLLQLYPRDIIYYCR